MAACHRNLVHHPIHRDSFLLRPHRRLHQSRALVMVAEVHYPNCRDLRLMTEDRRPAPQLLTAILRFLVSRRCWLLQHRDRPVVSQRGNQPDVVH